MSDMRKKNTQVMEHSQVYQSIHYLMEVRNATPTDRKRLLQNITTGQVLAMREVAKRLTNGHINPLRRATVPKQTIDAKNPGITKSKC